MNPACWLCESSSLSTFLRSDLSASTWVTDSHVWGADADGLAEHVTVLQRPLVVHDALKLVRSNGFGKSWGVRLRGFAPRQGDLIWDRR